MTTASRRPPSASRPSPRPDRTPVAVLGALGTLAMLVAAAPVRATDVGGDIFANTTWDVPGSPYVVTDTVFVRGGAILTIAPGVQVRLDPNQSILAIDASITANGTPDSTILFTRNQAGRWGILGGYGVQAGLNLRHCVFEWGNRMTYNTIIFEGTVSHVFASTVVEDCEFRQGGRDAVEFEGGSVTFRRNLIRNFARQGYNSFDQASGVVEDNRVESVFGDAFDITEPNGEALDFRNNFAIDIGDDALDIDSAGYATFRFFEAYDIADKGVSVAHNSAGIVVENMIIVDARGGQFDKGAAYTATSNSDLSVFNCVAYGCRRGFSANIQNVNYAGADMVVVNSITWNTLIEPVYVDTASTMTIIYSITDTPEPYPGLGNLNMDPRFVAPQVNDFRLQPNSPAIDAGWSDATPEVDIRGNPRVDYPLVPDTGGGPYTYYDIGAHEFDPSLTGADPAPPPVHRFGLRTYPSPAAGQVGIAFNLPEARNVEVAIFDPAGRLVERVFRGALAAGSHDLKWPGTTPRGRTNGIFFVRLRAGGDVQVEKLVRVR